MILGVPTVTNLIDTMRSIEQQQRALDSEQVILMRQWNETVKKLNELTEADPVNAHIAMEYFAGI